MWMMLQHSQPDDFVVATGESHSVREFLDEAGARAGVDWKSHVEIDPRYYRPTEVDYLQVDSSKARRLLGWRPSILFEELVRSMVENDMELARRQQTLISAGHKVVHRGEAAYA
jgi:GDPmannose 4,6-dehydratase